MARVAAIAVLLALAGAATALGQSPTLRQTLLAHPQGEALGGETTRPLAAQTAYTFLAANAQKERQRDFFFGNRLFNTNWTTAPGSVKSFDGLGPLFNRVSCSGCHTRDGRGRPPENGEGPMDSMLLRLSVSSENGARPHPVLGDQLNERAIAGQPAEGRARIAYQEVAGAYSDGEPYSLRKPVYTIVDPGFGSLGDNILISPRVAPAVIGLGLLEAVPDATLSALSDPDDSDGDGISGRINRVRDETTGATAVGRFGWKANQPSLRQQNAGAALGDIGITTSMHPAQNCTATQSGCAAAMTGGAPEMSDEFLDKLTLYTRLLAVPAQRSAADPAVQRGAALFRSMGCAACHMPTLVTGPFPEMPELAHQTIHPFTDLLLHDMGEALADGRPDFEATGKEWRTPPLWGLGLVETVNGHDLLLHDGRARGPAEAILWHGGEAEAAREAYRTAPSADREALIAFLKSL